MTVVQERYPVKRPGSRELLYVKTERLTSSEIRQVMERLTRRGQLRAASALREWHRTRAYIPLHPSNHSSGAAL